MAFVPRTTEEILDSLIITKNSITELNGLTNDASTSIWGLLLYITANAIQVQEQLFKQHIDEIESIKSSGIIGNKDWYVAKALEFQYGDNLIITEDFQIQYEIIDTNKKIIQSASSEVLGEKYILKIRRKGSDILTNDELLAFNTYINKIKFAGSKIIIYNKLPDDLKLIGNVIYNPEISLTDIITNTQNAINEYIANVGFNSTLYKNKLIDAVQKVNGVIDFEISSLEAKENGTINYTNIVNNYKSVAGYLKIADEYPLTNFLSYTAAEIIN